MLSIAIYCNVKKRFGGTLIKPRICSSHLLRLVNPCCNACFTILFLNIIMIMPASQNRSNCAFRYGLRRLATKPTAKSGLKHVKLYRREGVGRMNITTERIRDSSIQPIDIFLFFVFSVVYSCQYEGFLQARDQ